MMMVLMPVSFLGEWEYDYEQPQSINDPPDLYNNYMSPDSSIASPLTPAASSIDQLSADFASSSLYTSSAQYTDTKTVPNVISAAIPDQKSGAKVKVLLMQWEEEKPWWGPEVTALQTTLWSSFGLSAQVFLIPTKDSEWETKEYVSDFARDCALGDLLIVYYSGHGWGQGPQGGLMLQYVPSRANAT